jgi:hypothetical protein
LRRLDVAIALLVFAGVLAFYLMIQRGELVSWDGRQMAGVGRNLWVHHNLHTFGNSFGSAICPCKPYSDYGAGMSFLLAPLWGVQLSMNPRGVGWLFLANPVVLAATAAIVFGIGVELRWRRTTAVGAALVLGLLTMAPIYSTELFSEPAVTLGTAAVVLGLLRWRRGAPSAPWIVGLAIGWSMLFRPDALLLVGAALLAVPIFVSPERLRSTAPHWIWGVALPVGCALAFNAYFNWLRYGVPLKLGYDGLAFDNPLLDGLQRQLLSPGKGFFWYDPILLVALFGIPRLWRRDRALLVLVAWLATLRLLLYAKWPWPDGSVAWGPRFLLPWCALLVIPLGELWEGLVDHARRPSVYIRTGIATLACLSALVVIAGTWVPYTVYWAEVHHVTGPPATAQRVIERRIDAAFNTWHGSPLLVNVRSLARAKPLGWRWFRGGPGWPAFLAAATAMFALGLAGVAARQRDLQRGPPT